MTDLLEKALEAVRRMPPADQDAIAQAMLSMAHLGEAENVSEEDWQDVLAGLAEIERGEIATPEEVDAAFRSFGR